MPEVKILSRVRLMTFPQPDNPQPTIALTYQVGFMPPRTVYIPEKEDSPDKEREMVKADLDKAQTEKPETFEV